MLELTLCTLKIRKQMNHQLGGLVILRLFLSKGLDEVECIHDFENFILRFIMRMMTHKYIFRHNFLEPFNTSNDLTKQVS